MAENDKEFDKSFTLKERKIRLRLKPFEIVTIKMKLWLKDARR